MELESKLDGLGLYPGRVSESDIKNIEKIANEIVCNDELDVVLFANRQIKKDILVKNVKIDFILGDDGFVLPTSCRWKIN